MTYLALYREWRPQSFGQVVGQEHITRTLRNALRQGTLGHAYLFTGPRGTGKTTVARILAKAVNCLAPQAGEPCNECENCRAIQDGSAVDLLEIDAASNRSIDDIRDLKDKVKYPPVKLARKVYIIDEVHMLSADAFNALLKTLEEPPGHVLFVLATTDPQKVPATIVSRCQRFDFHRFAEEQIAARLDEVLRARGVAAEPAAVAAVARAAEGGMRDALSLLDQVLAFSGDSLSVQDVLLVLGGAPGEALDRLAAALADRDAAACLRVVAELAQQGKDMRQVLRDLLGHLRDLLLVSVQAAPPAADPAERERQASLLKRFSAGALTEAIKALAGAEAELRWSNQPRLLIEVTLARLCLQPAEVPEASRIPATPATTGRAGATASAPPPTHTSPPPPVPRPRAAGPGGEPPARRGAPAGGAPAGRRAATPEAADAPAAPPALQAVSEVPANAPPAAPVEPVAGRLDLDVVKKRWAAILDRLKAVRPRAHAFLSEGQPVAAGPGFVQVGFPPLYQFHRQQLENADIRGLVERVAGEVLGQPVKLDTTQIDPPDSARARREAVADHPHVRKVLEVLGGEIAEVREE